MVGVDRPMKAPSMHLYKVCGGITKEKKEENKAMNLQNNKYISCIQPDLVSNSCDDWVLLSY